MSGCWLFIDVPFQGLQFSLILHAGGLGFSLIFNAKGLVFD